MALDQDTVVRLLLGGRSMILAYLQSFLRDHHLVEDVFQEVTIISLNKREQIHDETHFRAWVRRVARLEALNALRKRGRLPETLSEPVFDLLESHWDNHEGDWSATRVEALRECIARLTPRSRRLVKMRYEDSLSGKRLAELVDRPLNAVYVALTRIHRTLAECVRRRMAREGWLGG